MELIEKGLDRIKLQQMILLFFCFLTNPMVKADSFYAGSKKNQGNSNS